MEGEIWSYFLTQGPFAVLFIWLLVYVMKSSKERENQLLDTLNKFSEKYDLIIEEVREIKSEMVRRS
ncbi:BhlA/UviB family holin-like peptide [Brevibacillus sp. HD1.4A]|uniref:BhlA/UviB family holin-like peptide n=1 Tax=Brevibacillus sp. HD1.4A TaxID=2738978 RepID=UPI00156BC757|nr:BhlA/UviB family holin-like peptide [Brevibacillus sp. HD1.4A]NRQ52001.1 hypothetical protein [Brevibacillus sp. HD1.4A]